MRLAELEVMGFKSFPARTKLTFHSGITSIVGPNGCGKSNIVDSIRWVLGEQSAKCLRGDRMESVLFNGSNKKNPGSMAEVALAIEDGQNTSTNGNKKTTVTRRLYRNGDSEYLLNGIPCLLRDVTELFADTGIGASAYMVMEQAMVESLISDRDESRREVFDEASGITKYKLKRRLAARKLESTEADLLRLRDLVAEVDKQVSSLKRQMRKAEGYKKLKDELKSLDLKVSRKQLEEAEQKLEELHEKLKSHGQGKDTSQTEQTTFQLQLENLRLELLQLEKSIEAERAAADELSRQIFKIQEFGAVGRQKIENLKENQVRLENEFANLATRKSGLEDSLAQKKKTAGQILEKLANSNSGQKSRESQLEELQKKLANAKLKFQEANQSWSEKILAQQKGESNLQMLEQKIKEAEIKISELEESLTGKRESAGKTKKELDERQSKLAALEKNQKQLLLQKERLFSSVAAREKEVADLQRHVAETQAELASEGSRREVLTEVWKSYQGYEEGVRALLGRKEEYGIIDTVANVIKTEEIYLLAVEAALGEKAGYLVTQNWSQVLQGLKTLTGKEIGEAGFISADVKGIRAKSDVHTSSPVGEGTVPLLSLVTASDRRLNEFTKVLLGNVYLVENEERASELLPQLEADQLLVTRAGEVFSPLGYARGGKKRGPALLGRTEQIQKAEKKIGELQIVLKNLGGKLESAVRELTALKAQLQSTYASLDQLTVNLRESQTELTEVKSSQTALLENLQDGEREKAKLKEFSQKVQEEIAQSKVAVQKQNEQLRQIEKSLNEQKEALKGEEAGLNQLQQELNQGAIGLVTLESQKEQLENDSLRLVESISEAQSRSQEIKNQTEEAAHQIQTLQQELKSKENELRELARLKEEKNSALQSLITRQHRLLEQINEIESKLKIVRQAHSETQEEIHQLDLARQETELQVRQIKNKIWEEYEVDLHTLQGREPEESGLIQNYAEQVADLRNRLKNYGAVNLLALEEYDREKERLSFLEKQMQDLISARDTLQSTITKINETARQLFLDTFQQVRTNFKEVLGKLFDEGEADLTLEEGVDPLEAKIEILAKPRGKKLVTLSQLSGGEKALVAISLLFSLYLVKPSPFCILDEVDAPLDDANIGRFVKLVRHFTDKTQFIIVTHNKLTMEAADSLYGVTMTEPGESQIVSVRFNKEPVRA